uniref:Uncharacterized protein n=1 Tax=Anguilla anguilla TaxID=7936 RepID=A0A0E9V574_ANGAN
MLKYSERKVKGCKGSD